MLESLDCGISDKLLARKRIKHLGRNLRFVHFGRIVFHKGTSLVISSLAKTQTPVCLDVIGRGPELENCRQLSRLLGLEKRVRFLDWFTSHDDLFDSLEEYRGLALPSIEDANGIVVQEAMALGLPVICLDWGGPQLLIEHGVSGYLIAPQDEAHIVERMAEYLDRLCNDGVLAESMSIAAREKACDWRWSKVTANWLDAYSKLIPVGAEREA
jgi:glycosyltransferase involved in cell wall biosynthesis